ncbi:MAG: OmpA family protein [Acidobacteria bacterium]|nr:OmpA family protein [Acidobacteriota bacterium]
MDSRKPGSRFEYFWAQFSCREPRWDCGYARKKLCEVNRSVGIALSASFLRANPQVRISIEGHCDERGSTAYNLGLGDRRANAARDFLVSLGISSDRISTISYGKERPFCTAHDESCWQQNRRAHLMCANCSDSVRLSSDATP